MQQNSAQKPACLTPGGFCIVKMPLLFDADCIHQVFLIYESRNILLDFISFIGGRFKGIDMELLVLVQDMDDLGISF